MQSAPPTTTTFHPFPLLPTELRLKIWSLTLALTPSLTHTFTLLNSDLDYLRLNRAACHDAYHICALRPNSIPSLLHTCRESRDLALQGTYTLGFSDTRRILAKGREETDGDVYTTCGHEVALNGGEGWERGIYWDREKDVVCFESSAARGGSDVGREDTMRSMAYMWGGKTGVRFGRMGKVAMSFETLLGGGIGQYLSWESIDVLFVKWGSREEMEAVGVGRGGWRWRNVSLDGEVYMRKMLAAWEVLAADGGEIDVRFVYER